MAHLSGPLFSALEALAGVVFETEPKEGGLGALSWYGMREVSSELARSQTFKKVSDDTGCAS
jgi:hypothetical protein